MLKDPNTELPDPLTPGAKFAPGAFADSDEEDDDTEEEEEAMPTREDAKPRPEAPSFIRKAYQTADPYIKQLLANPNDANARQKLSHVCDDIRKYYNEDGANEEIRFGIAVDFLCQTAEKASVLIEKLHTNPEDISARQNYEALVSTFEQHGKVNAWPESWCLESLPPTHDDDPRKIFYPQAIPLMNVLKDNPEDSESIHRLWEINREIHKYLRRSGYMDDEIDI